MKKIITLLLCIILCVILIILCFNKTFLRTTYKGLGDVEIFIPRFSFFVKEGGETVATFYSLRNKNILQKEIDNYLSNFEYMESHNGIGSGYENEDLHIENYGVVDNVLYRRIYVTYTKIR